MRIGIVGANGFIGKYLTNRYVTAGHDVDAVTRQSSDIEYYYAVDSWLKNRNF